MEPANRQQITIETSINAPVEKVWEFWTKPEHITQWNNASDDWYTPRAENDLRVGGSFLARMEAKDGSVGFDFSGTYNAVEALKYIEYSLGDGRIVSITFSQEDNQTKVVETFDAENTHPIEMQQAGWQAILNNFKNHVETNG